MAATDNDTYFMLAQLNCTVQQHGPAADLRDALQKHCEQEGLAGMFQIVNVSPHAEAKYTAIVRFERSLAEDLEVIQGELPEEEDDTVRNIALKSQFERELKCFTSDYKILSGPDFPDDHEQEVYEEEEEEEEEEENEK